MNQRVDLSREQCTAVRGLFDALADAPHQERERALAQGGRPAAVIAEAKALLAAADGASDFMAIDANPLAGMPDPAAEPSYRPLATGTQVGSFAIVWLLGRGGQGEVYRADDSKADSTRSSRSSCCGRKRPSRLPASNTSGRSWRISSIPGSLASSTEARRRTGGPISPWSSSMARRSPATVPRRCYRSRPGSTCSPDLRR